MVVKRSTGLLLAGMAMGASFLTATSGFAADMDSMVTKAPVVTAAVAAAGAGRLRQRLPDFFLTACQLSWYGVRFYGTVDMGGTYQTHGTPFDPNHPVGASYLLGNSGTNAVGRTAGFGLGPNALSQSNVGVEMERTGRRWMGFRRAGRTRVRSLFGAVGQCAAGGV